MRKIILATVAVLPLAACQTSSTTPSISTLIGTIGGQLLNQYAPEIAALVKGNCGFIITVADLSGLSGQFPDVASAAAAICSAARASARRSRAVALGNTETVVVVRGARVRGHF